MKQIDLFVDEVYQNVGGNKKEIQELKAEMKGHLLEAVHELKSEGKSEEEAINIAIERFGGEKEMRSVVGQLFKAQKTFAKWVLYLAVTIFILSSTVFGFMWVNEQENANENSIVGKQISTVLEGKEVISEDIKKEIIALVEGTDHISKVGIYNGSGSSEPIYEYERNLGNPNWLFADFFQHSSWSDQWYVEMENKHIGSIMSLILIFGIAVYVTLFTIWAIINAYHHRRLNVGWIILFALLNVVGYFIYVLVGKRKVRI